MYDLYEKEFEKFWKDRFARLSLGSLVEYVRWLEKFIDSDMIFGCPLNDEILDLYEFVRDECVDRCEVSLSD